MHHCFLPIFRHPWDIISSKGWSMVKSAPESFLVQPSFVYQERALWHSSKSLGHKDNLHPIIIFLQLLSPPHAYFEQEPAEETRHEGKPNKKYCNYLFPPGHMILFIISKLEIPLKGQDVINHYTVNTIFAIAFSSINNVQYINKTKNILQCNCYYCQNRQTQP